MLLLLLTLLADPAPKSPATAKEGLQAVQVLVGTWKATGTPEGTREERQAGFWTETVTVAWKFAADDVSLEFQHDGGKPFQASELRYRPKSADYELTVTTPGDAAKPATYAGPLTRGRQGEPVLTLTRDTANESQRLVLTLLHGSRYVLRSDAKPKGGSLWTKKYQVGATKEGEAFANVPKGIDCVVSGGKGTIPVTYKGKTYYVCCGGCRDAFNDNPEAFLAAAAKKK
jgi:YHS domain-containing protein